MNVKFYMMRDGVDSVYIDLESYFNGMKYSKCEGLEDYGKPKNIYTETYSDADMLRVFLPTEVKREATTLTFTFIFVGDNRQAVYDEFCDFITGHKIYYYDTARAKQAYLVLMNKVSPSEDVYKGSKPYIKADFKFQNLWGECKPYGLLVLSGSSNSCVIGESVIFQAYFNGNLLDAGVVSLYINNSFETNGVAGLYSIVYSPSSSGVKNATVKYTHNGMTHTSNVWTVQVLISTNPEQPET